MPGSLFHTFFYNAKQNAKHRTLEFIVVLAIENFSYLFIMKKSILKTCILLIFLLYITEACVDHNIGSSFIVSCDNSATISYSANVVPIIQTKCAIEGCHVSGTGLPDWTVLSNLQEKKSEVQRRITLPLTDPDKMPRVGSITQEERQTIYCWIQQGALDN